MSTLFAEFLEAITSCCQPFCCRQSCGHAFKSSAENGGDPTLVYRHLGTSVSRIMAPASAIEIVNDRERRLSYDETVNRLEIIGQSSSATSERSSSPPSAINHNNITRTDPPVCLVSDIDFAPPLDVTCSPPSVIGTDDASPVRTNILGPMKTSIEALYTDDNHVTWMVFPYSKNKKVKRYKIRCDVETVPPNRVRNNVKTVRTAVDSTFEPHS